MQVQEGRRYGKKHAHHRNNGGHGSHEGVPLGTREEADPGFVGYKDPASQVNRPVGRGDGNCSWLGRFEDNGWSIQITPRLTREQWNLFAIDADDYREDGTSGYYALDLAFLHLREMFPDHTLVPHCPPPEKKANRSK